MSMDPAAALRDYILDQLRSQAWRAGHRLESERALGQRFALGRSGVRRVLQALKRKGLITQTVGSGTYVSEQVRAALAQCQWPPAGADHSGAQDISPAELMSARLALEPALIELVIGNATAADFARMDECNARAEAASSLEGFEHWDAELHAAIADAAHNGLISSVLWLMNEVRAQGEWGLLKRRSATPERRLAYQQQHRALVAALKQRDLELARALCLAHLLQVRVNLLGH